MKNVHQTVLLKEAIDGLDLHPGDIFLDATIGGGGHSAEAARRMGNSIKIIGIDLDALALERAKLVLSPQTENFSLHLANFRNLDKVLAEADVKKVTKIIFDLGLSSNQLELSGKGFTFQKREPLDMRFGEGKLTAKEIVNSWEEKNLADVIYGYGEERFARQIAKKIVERREIAPIETTEDLVKVIETAVPSWYRHRRIHYATKTFQALRIATNDELEALKDALRKGIERLEGSGRMAVISFHSLEDRLVKHFFKEEEKLGRVNIINKKAIRPRVEEIEENPRARSAKLRLIVKLSES